MGDVKQAAERLRRLRNGEAYYDIYRPLVASDDELLDDHDSDDRALVIEAYLAEHLADADEPITYEWWLTIASEEHGFIWIGDWWLDFSDGIVLFESPSESLSLPHITTRGQLRKLLSALSTEMNRE